MQSLKVGTHKCLISAGISCYYFLGHILFAGLNFVLFATSFLNKWFLLALTFNTDGKVSPTVSLIAIPKFFHSMQEVTGPKTTTVDTKILQLQC